MICLVLNGRCCALSLSPGSAAADQYGPLARFAFCKQDETLRTAADRLRAPAAVERGAA